MLVIEVLHDGELFASVLRRALVQVVLDDLDSNQIATLTPPQLDNARVTAAQTMQQFEATDGLVALRARQAAARTVTAKEGLRAKFLRVRR